jgi:glycerol-3-phosphate acyltransferase PlsY
LAALDVLWLILACLGSYLSGSVPYSVIIGKLYSGGKDLRDYNVGNPGGFNAVMTYGLGIGLMVIAIDILKGLVPIIIIDYVFSLPHFTTSSTSIFHTLAVILGPAFCVLGHNHPVWLKFKGGRGTAVFIGTLLYVNPIVLLTFFLPFGLIIGLLKVPTRVSNIISGIFFIPSALFLPIGPPWTNILNDWVLPAQGTGFLFMTQFFIALALWLAWIPRHWPSLVLYIKGEEEWTMDIKEGQKISEEADTVAKVKTDG